MKKSTLSIMIIMAVIACLSLIAAIIDKPALNISGLTIVLATIFYFIERRKKDSQEIDSLSPVNFKKAWSNKKIRFLLPLPLIMNAVSLGLAYLLIPEFIDHIKARSEFVSTGKLVLLLLELAFLALCEEIAWRAFFQEHLSEAKGFKFSLIVSSLLFTILHAESGNFVVVSYDLLFVFINTLIYAYIFEKSKGVLLSALSHFAANAFGIISLLFI